MEKKRCLACGKDYTGKGKYYCSVECRVRMGRGEAGLGTDDNDSVRKLLESFQPQFESSKSKRIDELMVCGDFHMPYLDIDFFEKMINVAKIFLRPPRTLLIAGDLIDFESISFWGTENKDSHIDIDIQSSRLILNVMFKTFDEVYLCIGNHEKRLMKKLDWFFTSQMMGDLFTVNEKLHVVPYPYLNVTSGDHVFRCTHPKTYSRIGSATVGLATKYRVTVLGFHGHNFSIRQDPSGQDLGYDVGCMTDAKLHSYIRQNETTHPMWTKGFAVVRNGAFHPFTDNAKMTDWDFWLNDLPSRLKNGRLWA